MCSTITVVAIICTITIVAIGVIVVNAGIARIAVTIMAMVKDAAMTTDAVTGIMTAVAMIADMTEAMIVDEVTAMAVTQQTVVQSNL